jgi:hypothetical protein
MTDLERLRAARDAAVARAEAAEAALLLAGKQMLEFGDRQHSDGERRATVAIVADLRAMSALYSTGLPSVLAARYETGEHLKEVKLAAQTKETSNE